MSVCAQVCERVCGRHVTCECRCVRVCVCVQACAQACVCVPLGSTVAASGLPPSQGRKIEWPGHGLPCVAVGSTAPATCVLTFGTCWSRGLHSVRRSSHEDDQKVGLTWTARSLGISKPGLTSSGFFQKAAGAAGRWLQTRIPAVIRCIFSATPVLG